MLRSALKLSIFILFFLSFVSYAHGQNRAFVDGEVIVKLKGLNSGAMVSGQNFVSKASQKKGMKLKSAFSRMGVYHFAVKRGQTVNQAVEELQADPDVEYAEPNYIFSKSAVGEVEQAFSIQEVSTMAGSGGYLATNAHIEVQTSWSVVSQNSVPVVAVIDTGLDLTHPVFAGAGAVWTNTSETANGVDDDGNGYVDDIHGWNFVTNTGAVIDDDGHGTHVAGIILGVTQDIYTTPYVSAKIRIMPLKFLDGEGLGRTSDAIRAIYYAVNNGASILNNSWGGSSYSAALHEAISYAYSAGVVFVAAAGNNGSNNDASPMYPASYDVPNIISVAATTDADALAYFSNYGKSSVHLASPGVFILSTLPGVGSTPGGYGSLSGTSMATPFVSGLAALMKMEQPGLLGYQAKQLILQESDSVMGLNDVVQSEGRLNVYNTIQATKSASISSSQPGYTYTNGDRGLASSLAGGGCGLVTKMILDGKAGSGGLGGGQSSPHGLSRLAYLLFLLLPLIIYLNLRQKTPEQRRKHERYKINSEVKINVGGRELSASVCSISVGGAQINTDALLDQGGIVSMVIRSPDGQEQIAVEGRVVWSEANKAYGVQFAKTSVGIRESITKWSKALAKI